MRELALILLLIPSLASATITETSAQRTSATTGATNAATLTVTYPGAVDPGDGKYHYAVIAVASSATNIWLSDSANYSTRLNSSGASLTTAVLVMARVTTAHTAFVINANSAFPISACATEIVSDLPLIQDLQRLATTSGTTADSGTTGTTRFANEIVLAALAHRLQSAVTTGTFASPTNSFTEAVAGGKSTNNNSANGDREADLLFKIVSATGTQNTSATVTGSNQVAGNIVTFYEVPCSAYCPTPTPTPTATFTPTATATATATATPSATVNCPVVCPTATATPSATFTPTATASATNTPTPTATPSSTPTPVINNVIYGQ